MLFPRASGNVLTLDFIHESRIYRLSALKGTRGSSSTPRFIRGENEVQLSRESDIWLCN